MIIKWLWYFIGNSGKSQKNLTKKKNFDILYINAKSINNALLYIFTSVTVSGNWIPFQEKQISEVITVIFKVKVYFLYEIVLNYVSFQRQYWIILGYVQWLQDHWLHFKGLHHFLHFSRLSLCWILSAFSNTSFQQKS